MKHFILITACLLTGLCACYEAPEIQPQYSFLKSRILSRTSTENSSLPDGATALFNITGALQLTDQVFTCFNNHWECDNELSWDSRNGDIYLTAVHPVLNEYTGSTLYKDNKLTDVLIAKDTLTSGNKVELTFKHLFSSLTVHIQEDIREELQEFSLTVPQTITTLIPSDGSYTTSTETCTFTETYSGADSYSLILPPMETAVLILQLTMQDGTIHSHTLLPYTFKSGYSYECNILKEDQRPGIRTAEDLIAFSLLINKQSYTGEKTLTDFGEEINGETVYRLINDLTFTEEESSRLLPIGYYEYLPFTAIFDGEGHTITNLTLPDKSVYSKVNVAFSGLFGCIGSEGVVKNLHIRNTQTVQEPTCTRVGFIATQNEGTIINCSVEGSIIYNGTNEASGFICAQLSSTGSIINCYAENDTVSTSNSHRLGGIAGYANGTILNCYTSNNYYNISTSNPGAGGIAGASSSSYLLTIANCYNHDTGNKHFWPLMESAKKVSANNFLYNSGTPYNSASSSNVTTKNIYKYDEQYQVDGTDITTLLNNWITTDGKTTYPDVPFKNWTLKEGSICFE